MPFQPSKVIKRYLYKRAARARVKVGSFLKENGFEHDVNSKKQGRFGGLFKGCSFLNGQGLRHTYPLHLAVMQENVEITSLLLEPG